MTVLELLGRWPRDRTIRRVGARDRIYSFGRPPGDPRRVPAGRQGAWPVSCAVVFPGVAMSNYSTNEFKTGLKILIDGDPYAIV
jgi:hypothetical protein